MLLTNKPGSRVQAAIHMPKEAWPTLSVGHRFFEFWEWVPGDRFGERQRRAESGGSLRRVPKSAMRRKRTLQTLRPSSLSSDATGP